MAAVTLELEIDSVAHPELYALVAAIGNASFRAERMRQLAATGMIWEQLRLAPNSQPAVSGQADTPAAVSHLALVATVRPSALDALALPVLRDEVPPRASADAAGADREPRPQAMAIVDSTTASAVTGTATQTATAPATATAPTSTSTPTATPTTESADAQDAPPWTPSPHPPAPTADTLPAVHMPGTRSRLMRMKNRGLFTNE